MNEDGLIEIKEADQPHDLDYESFSKKPADKIFTGSKNYADIIEVPIVYQFFYATDD